MPLAIALAVGLILASDAPATGEPATWYVIGDTPAAMIALNQASIDRSGDVVKVQEARLFKNILKTEYGDSRRVDEMLWLNCRKHTFATGEMTIYGIKGDVLNRQPGKVKFTRAAPDTAPARAEALVCGGQSQTSAGPYRLQSIMDVAAASPQTP